MLGKAITSLFPDARDWYLSTDDNGEWDFDTLIWPEKNGPKPTKNKLETEAARLAALPSTEYKVNRIRKYRVRSDHLFIEWQYLSATSDPAADSVKKDWLAAVDEIKAEDPKP